MGEGAKFLAALDDVLAERDRLRAVNAELLEALREMQAHWHQMIGCVSPPSLHDVNARALAAIAKATGDEP